MRRFAVTLARKEPMKPMITESKELTTAHDPRIKVNKVNVYLFVGFGCGSVGWVVASETRHPRFDSGQKNFLNIFTVNCWKDENKENRGREWPIYKKQFLTLLKVLIPPFGGSLPGRFERKSPSRKRFDFRNGFRQKSTASKCCDFSLPKFSLLLVCFELN